MLGNKDGKHMVLDQCAACKTSCLMSLYTALHLAKHTLAKKNQLNKARMTADLDFAVEQIIGLKAFKTVSGHKSWTIYNYMQIRS